MEKEYLISVIIPVYNKEPYLRECLDSVLNQSYKNLEVICIDDGSSDNSISILEEYVSKDSRLSLYRSEHKGPSSARNIGIRQSHGDYIHFMDADDFLKENSYYLIFDSINRSNKEIDLVLFYFDFFSNGNEIPKKFNKRNEYINEFGDSDFSITSLKENSHYIIDLCGESTNIANKIFKSNVIKKNNVFLNNSLNYFEETDFYYHLVLYCKDILAMPYNFYSGRLNIPNSQIATKLEIENVFNQIFFVYSDSIKKYKELGKNIEYSFTHSVLDIATRCYLDIKNRRTRLLANKQFIEFILKFDNELINQSLNEFNFNIDLLEHMKTNDKLKRIYEDERKKYIDTNNKYEQEKARYEQEKTRYEQEKTRYEEEKRNKENILNSETFKIGKIIVYPFRLFKKICKKISKKK